MDDHSIKTLNESSNEWCIRLTNILSFHIIEGFRSIFAESWNICKLNNEPEKYLMTFQNMISQIPKWNDYTVKEEVKRIKQKSSCSYLEDLITCVHIIQLKLLTCVRVSNTNKKIDINIPSIYDFVHKVYINVARRLYSNIFLFEREIPPLNIQRNNREFEIMVNTCILNCVRENIPIDEILRSYMYEQNDIVEPTIQEKPKGPELVQPIVEKNKVVSSESVDVDEKEEETKTTYTPSESEFTKINEEPIVVKSPVNESTEFKKSNITLRTNSKFENKPENFNLSLTNQDESSNISSMEPTEEFTPVDINPGPINTPGDKKNKLTFNDTITAVYLDGEEESLPLVDLSRDKTESSFDSLNDDYGDSLQIENENLNLDLGIVEL